MEGGRRRRTYGVMVWVLLALGTWLSCADQDGSASQATTMAAATSGPDHFRAPSRPHPALPIEAEDFVGSDACATCHAEVYPSWASSTHGRAGGETTDVLIVPFDGREIRFADAVVFPEQGADGNVQFRVQQVGFADTVVVVDGVVGGGHMLGGGTQGFVSRGIDGTVRFLPWDYSRQGDAWFCNTGSRTDEGWVPITLDMRLADCGDWPPVRVLGTVPRFANCQSCHGSQIVVDQDPGQRMTTDWTSLAITCESCHGPGSTHISWAESGAQGADIGLLSKATDGVDESLDTCFGCHGLKDVVQEGYLSGKPLEDFYALKLPILGDDPYTDDGRIKTFGYQATHLASACYLSGSMTCVSCHEPHGQGYWDESRKPLASPFDDGQCTACHAAKAVDPESHTFHPPESEGARCVSCHMPYLQHPEVGDQIPFARSDHTIPVPRPTTDSRMGLVSACRGCHTDQSEIQLQGQAERWWGALKPHRPLVAGLTQITSATGADQAATLLIKPEEFDPLIQFQAMARFLQGWVGLDGGLGETTQESLRAVASGDDLDLRALALATMHWAGAIEGPTQTEQGTTSNQPLHRRWGMVLTFLGDEARDEGDVVTAEVAYQKALAVLPEDPQVLLSIGLARNQQGDFTRAIEVFRRSLAADPNRALTHVNLGVALSGSGDVPGATQAYHDALAVDPTQPLAYFNLGNIHLRSGNLPGAIESYRSAVTLSPGLSQAHFALGVAYIQSQRYAEALPHARRAVEFNPGDERAQQMLRDLIQATGGG